MSWSNPSEPPERNSKMPDAHYQLPELAALYDLENGWSDDREFYRQLAGSSPRDVIEVGCGTGIIARRMAHDGHRVTGVDPARDMLDIGRSTAGGDRVEWVEAYAQDFRLARRFDLAFMTGHAFQVLLADADVLATLNNIAGHLAPGGTFAFETRNPSLPWERMFAGTTTLETERGDIPIERRVHWRRDDLIHFDSIYKLADGDRVSTSTLRFMPLETTAGLLAQCGFSVETVHGDWHRGAFDPATSREIIILATKSAQSRSPT